MKNRLVIGFILGLSVAIFYPSCANRGVGPQGGPIDSIPPVIVKTNPLNGALNYSGKTVDIYFNEYILINGSTDNILISPPQQHPADIKAIGKHIHVEFQDSMAANTTYTIDFGDMIVDNNEKNPYPNYTFSFSTGKVIDSLEIYGQLVDAGNLSLISGVVVGLHANRHDSALSTIPFTRIGRTNDEGEFSIKNIHEGTYRLYALQDQSHDYLYQPGEALAFHDEPITPYINIKEEVDTIWQFVPDSTNADSVVIRRIPDSVYTQTYYYFEPSDLLLRLFKEDKKRHYFLRANRDKAHTLTLYFSAPQQELPTIHALRPESDTLGLDTGWVDFTQHALVQANATLDTITYWLTDSAAIRMDTLRFTMAYLKSDSTLQLLPQLDTVQNVYRAPKLSAKVRETQLKRERAMGLQIKCNAKQGFNIYDTITITSPAPVASVLTDSIHLYHDVDTTHTPVPFTLQRKDSIGMQWQIIAAIKGNNDYSLHIDSAAMVDIYGHATKKDQFTLHVRSLEEYATLTVKVPSLPTVPTYIQLLNEKDEPVRTLQAQANGTKFTFLEPGIYYMRFFLDENGDKKWTTGEWQTRRQPEPVYYFPKRMNLRANWDFEQTYDWTAIPLLDQKPNAIRNLAPKGKNQNP